MKKTTPIGVRLQPETKAALERAAKDDMRPQSAMIEKIMVDWFRERGYLPKLEDPDSSPTPKKAPKAE